ncbi:MAG: E3 binding domain-containing protein, partial [Actinobacteria bacterium]|nr:E3 binding domain-containing protein [Actinomycetota bacterium]
MATEVKLPRLGQGMEAGTIVKWLKAEGDRVERGDPLYELDTEKVTQEVEAEASGVLLKIAVQSGEVPVGQTVAVIGEAGEAVPDPGGARHRDESVTPASKEAKSSGSEVAAAGARHHDRSGASRQQANGGRIKASPLARRIARERGIDLGGLSGTGPDGRIVAEDVERAQAAPAAPAALPAGDVESIPLTTVRRTIARRLTAAWEAPVFELVVSA